METGMRNFTRRSFLKTSTFGAALAGGWTMKDNAPKFELESGLSGDYPSVDENAFGFHAIGVEPGAGTPVEFLGIPFEPVVEGREARNMVKGQFDLIPVGQLFDALYFLGMTTERPEGSEGWGRWERYHDHSHRLFIGDRVGSILVFYDDPDATLDTFPVIFGVNVWPYEMYAPLQPEEAGLETFGGPYREPFDSDPEAARLLRESLLSIETTGGKPFRYIFGVRPRPKPIRNLWIRYEGCRTAGYVVSAVTGLRANTSSAEAFPAPVYDQPYFLRQSYYAAMDRLARRLYQFRDDLPQSVEPECPAGYTGSRLKFVGSNCAAILGNVWMHNIHDLGESKVDRDGRMCASTKGAPSFGHTRGFGTFRRNVGTYSALMCARDLGAMLAETIHAGRAEVCLPVVDRLLRHLYDPNHYSRPAWKRIVNGAEIGSTGFSISKENDGHGAIMLAIAAAAQKGLLSERYVRSNWAALRDAADWFVWQIEHPEASGFDEVLCSRSEAAYQDFGGFDLFSNTYGVYGLRAYMRLARQTGQEDDAERWNRHAATLWAGILKTFLTVHPRHGRIFTDLNEDCWSYEYKQFAPLFALANYETLDPALDAPEVYELARNTYAAQKEAFFSPASGREMGYGQGYLTQTAILLDESADMRALVEAAGAFCYHHTDHNYLVPEGIIAHPSGRFWFRNGDLGNGVQQAEIVKCLRLLVGVDDLRPERGIRLVPRLPEGWTSLEVTGHPVALGGGKTSQVTFLYSRTASGYRLDVEAHPPLMPHSMRFGPFATDVTRLKSNAESTHLTIRPTGGSVFAYLAPSEPISTRQSFTVSTG